MVDVTLITYGLVRGALQAVGYGTGFNNSGILSWEDLSQKVWNGVFGVARGFGEVVE